MNWKNEKMWKKEMKIQKQKKKQSKEFNAMPDIGEFVCRLLLLIVKQYYETAEHKEVHKCYVFAIHAHVYMMLYIIVFSIMCSAMLETANILYITHRAIRETTN